MNSIGFIRFALAYMCLVLLSASAAAGPTTTVTYFVNDAIGSPVAALDESGDLLWRQHYLPFGAETDPDPESLFAKKGYTGHAFDRALGLNYMGARYYDPLIGRFMAKDPVGFLEDNPASFNRYAYANNNPYRYIDPDGQVPIDTVWDAASIVYDLGKIGYGFISSNPALMAEGTVDLAADTAALFIPYVPAGSTKIARATADGVVDATKSVSVSRSRFPESAKHIEDAVASGKPNTLTINRGGAAANRRDSLRGVQIKPGLDRDEFPPAMFQEGGKGASVRHINRADNRGSGACIGAQCRGLPDGSRVRIDVVD